MNSIAVGLAVFFGICAIACAGILIVYVAVSFGGKRKADNNYILYLELTRQAILETSIRGMDYKGPAKLYRAPFPFLGKLNETIEECKKAIEEDDRRTESNASNAGTGS
jgi:hypothetical protein